MAVRELQVLYLGMEEGIEKSFFTFRTDEGKKINAAFLCFLIKTDTGNILVDTGPNPDDAVTMSEMHGTTIKLGKSLPDQLTDIGLSPAQINTIIVTHLHCDHIGLLTEFTNADVIVQKDEYKFALDPEPYGAVYYFEHLCKPKGIKWKLVEGDCILETGITLLFTPGHTAGCQSVMVDLPNFGPLIISGDTGFLQENFEKEIIPMYFGNPRQALLSLKRLNTWSAIRKAPIITTHDLDYWQKHVKKFPEVYT